MESDSKQTLLNFRYMVLPTFVYEQKMFNWWKFGDLSRLFPSLEIMADINSTDLWESYFLGCVRLVLPKHHKITKPHRTAISKRYCQNQNKPHSYLRYALNYGYKIQEFLFHVGYNKQ